MSARVAISGRTISASVRQCDELGSNITKELPEMLNAFPLPVRLRTVAR
jgi:hypothetical protein